MSYLVLPPWLHEEGDAVVLDILVAPRAARTRVLGVHDQRLKIQLSAPPVEGQANDALVRFLAELLDVARAQVDVISGHASRRKRVRLAAVAAQRVLLKIGPL